MNILRPTTFNEIVGQKDAIESLKIAIKSAVARDDAVSHILFECGPGLGKTTMASAIANERGAKLEILNGANIKNTRDIKNTLLDVDKHTIVFIDEIHRLAAPVEELLYPVMEDFRLDMGDKEAGTQVSIDLPRFTLVGATTSSGKISRPLYDRFEYKIQLIPYTHDELGLITYNSAQKLGLTITGNACINIARRGRGTPRIANSLLKRCRDYAYATGHTAINNDVVDASMRLAGIDEVGMTNQDRVYLEKLKERYYSGPIGLATLSALCGIESDIISEVIEPYLLEMGLVLKMQKGRILNMKKINEMGVVI